MSPEDIAKYVVGVIPAAGVANRLGPLPCSKELIPIGLQRDGGTGELSTRAVAQYLLDKFRLAGIRKTLILIRSGKWDIPAYFADGSRYGMHVSYLIPRYLYGPPFSVDQAYPYLENKIVALGFPDILFSEDRAFGLLIDKLTQSDADVVLGLFPADRPEKVDMVSIDDAHTVRRIEIKPRSSELEFTWGIAVWRAEFTEYMHTHLAGLTGAAKVPHNLHIGDVLTSALADGMRIKGYPVSRQPYIDIGTPDDLQRAWADNLR